MIEPQFVRALGTICARLEKSGVKWAVTGSLGMVLQGMDLAVHDIDLQTDNEGAYEIERRLSEFVLKPVLYKATQRMRSRLGLLEIEAVQVEIIGGIQKLLEDGTWEEPVDVELHKRWAEVGGLMVPVLSLEYEYGAYLAMGRTEKAELIRKWLEESGSS
jgi:hypothetical protein